MRGFADQLAKDRNPTKGLASLYLQILWHIPGFLFFNYDYITLCNRGVIFWVIRLRSFYFLNVKF